ncbi:Protein of unknown function [Bacillus wiedmannii]|nr:Protein of unknown function [Bacillus wiedmannii]
MNYSVVGLVMKIRNEWEN